jgi:Spy/CpxP family protein refolding chaperone
MLKHFLLSLTLAAIVYTVVPSAGAQDNPSNDPQTAPSGAPSEHRRGGHFDPEQRTEMLTKQLKLTSDQRSKVLDILKSEQSQIQSLRSDSSVPQDSRRAKMMEIRKSSDEQLRALLDSNQQKKWDTMQTRREQWQGHHQDGLAPSGPDSTPQN